MLEIPVTWIILWAVGNMSGKHFPRHRRKRIKATRVFGLPVGPPVFLSFLMTKQASACVSFFCYRIARPVSLQRWSNAAREARLGQAGPRSPGHGRDSSPRGPPQTPPGLPASLRPVRLPGHSGGRTWRGGGTVRSGLIPVPCFSYDLEQAA